VQEAFERERHSGGIERYKDIDAQVLAVKSLSLCAAHNAESFLGSAHFFGCPAAATARQAAQ
jgi:hypothetical protein